MTPIDVIQTVVVFVIFAFLFGLRVGRSMSSEAMTNELVRRAVKNKMRVVTEAAIAAEIEQTACALVRSAK